MYPSKNRQSRRSFIIMATASARRSIMSRPLSVAPLAGALDFFRDGEIRFADRDPLFKGAPLINRRSEIAAGAEMLLKRRSAFLARLAVKLVGHEYSFVHGIHDVAFEDPRH